MLKPQIISQIMRVSVYERITNPILIYRKPFIECAVDDVAVDRPLNFHRELIDNIDFCG